ncbi:uncharacterized protein LOC113229112 [Hyposmocoma kahamanoa]|uniref:uncharacterized protein LOC113229112 n=1 Tax=Hyposmocoma kahamanoa TaxID=1477025 RepID=UPI000E6D5FD9|nr:uncharacterized protein LOC113229112 [Hyposmocoma kahamanoa]
MMLAHIQRAWLRAKSRWSRSVRARLACSVAVAAALALAALLPARVALRSAASFPHVPPRRLAHHLADFSYHSRFYPHMGEWAVLEESSNGSAWRYEVEYACGERCSGRARVLALDSAHAHRIFVAHRTCSPPPALPWPALCDEWETETVVTGAGDPEGARLEEHVVAKCSWWRAISGACSRLLLQRRDAHFTHLHALFSVATSPAFH